MLNTYEFDIFLLASAGFFKAPDFIARHPCMNAARQLLDNVASAIIFNTALTVSACTGLLLCRWAPDNNNVGSASVRSSG